MNRSTTNHPKKFRELEHQLKAEHEAHLRLAAELENLQKRFAQEREQIIKFANRDLLEKLFPIFDNFYRASSHAPEVNAEDAAKLSDDELKKIFNYFEGLKMVERQMESILVGAGLQRIATKGQPFDHNLHEAISHEPSSDVPSDHIIDEIEAGWEINGQVVKPAKVRVSKG